MGDFLPLGMCLMADRPTVAGISTPGINSVTLNSDQTSGIPSGSGSGTAYNSNSGGSSTSAVRGSEINSISGSANNSTSLSGTVNTTPTNRSFPFNSRNLREMSEAEVVAITTGEWHARQNERIQEAMQLKRKVAMNRTLVRNQTALGISVPQSTLDINRLDADQYKHIKTVIVNAQKRLDYLRNL